MIDSFTGEYRWLSNFFPCQVCLDTELYDSVESAYQAAKTLNVDDRRKIQLMKPGEAKKFGKSVKLREDWEQVKLQIMENLLRQKFASGSSFAEKLLDTDYEELIEGNWWYDTFWGRCKGIGENHLGRILMTIRYDLRNEPTNEIS
jgi:ribA/ribD-fused uncharacterized protein